VVSAVESAFQIAKASSVNAGGYPQRTGCFGGEFVVAAAEVLQEREPGDDDFRGAVGAQAAPGSQPVFEPAVVRLDSVVRTPFHVVPRRTSSSSTRG
jgi:hypothetical protein